MDNKYGLPVLIATELDSFLLERGIRVWPEMQAPMDLQDYVRGNLTESQREEVRRFAPRNEVLFFQQPNGKPFRGFRTVARNSTTTFALLPGDLVPVIAEFKHGAGVVSLVPPSGVPGRNEAELEDPLRACAMREFEEETGFELERVEPLSSPEGLPVSARKSSERMFPFLGWVKEPIVRRKSKLDDTEYLEVLLIPLEDWLLLIQQGKVLDESAVSVTYLALHRLGRLTLNP